MTKPKEITRKAGKRKEGVKTALSDGPRNVLGEEFDGKSDMPWEGPPDAAPLELFMWGGFHPDSPSRPLALAHSEKYARHYVRQEYGHTIANECAYREVEVDVQDVATMPETEHAEGGGD